MKTKLITMLLGLTMSVFVVGCGDDDSPTGSSGVAEFEVIQPVVDSYAGGSKAPTTSAQALFDNLNDGDASNDPVVLSVRAASAYEAGHIQGAINIPWKEIGTSAKLADLPTDQQIVVYCYTGHTGGVATTALNAMGYDAVNLKFGMMSWTDDLTVLATTPFSAAPGFATETTANIATSTYDLADPDYTDSKMEDEIVVAAVNATTAKTPTISAQALFDNLNDGDASNDPVVLSVRAAGVYALGHVPGAINISWREIAKTESLQKLPTDKQIVVYCYTGHTGAVATTTLNMLGYNAVNMKFGMMGWSNDLDVVGTTPFSAAAGFPTVQ
jgi:sulfur-carrier protein adenylyltransferase/sulfurtransferase